MDELLRLSVFMKSDHSVEELADVENYLARLEQFPFVLQQIRVNLDIQQETGCVPPKAILESALKGVKDYPDYLLKDFSAKAENLHEKDELITRCQRIIDEVVRPAYEELALQLRSLLPDAVDNVSELPGGRDYYA